MGRRIVTTQFQASKSHDELDGYWSRVLKYIPADIVAAWTAVTGLIKSANNIHPNTLWIAFFLGLILTAVWTLKQTKVRGLPIAMTQTVVATVAFFVWVFALGDPFASLSFYRPLYGSLLLILYTLVVGLIIPSES